MTLAWAIIIVAVLFLLDRHHLLKKTLVAAGITAGIAALLLAVGYAGMLGYQRLRGRWEAHQLTEQAKQFAAQNECFGLSNGKLHPINEAGVPCSETEKIHQRGTSLPPLLPSCDSLSDEEKGTPTSGRIHWDLPSEYNFPQGPGPFPIPAGTVLLRDDEPVCMTTLAPPEPIISTIVLNNHAYIDRSKISSQDITKANNAFIGAFNNEPVCAGLSLTVDYIHPFENPPADDKEQYWDLSIAPELAGYQTGDGRIVDSSTTEGLTPIIKFNWYMARHGFGHRSSGNVDAGVYHDIVAASDVCKKVKKYNQEIRQTAQGTEASAKSESSLPH